MTFVDDLTANSQLHWSDYLVLIIYFLVVIGVGIWVRDLSYYYHLLYVCKVFYNKFARVVTRWSFNIFFYKFSFKLQCKFAVMLFDSLMIFAVIKYLSLDCALRESSPFLTTH